MAKKAEIKAVPRKAITALLIVSCFKFIVIKTGKTSNKANRWNCQSAFKCWSPQRSPNTYNPINANIESIHFEDLITSNLALKFLSRIQQRANKPMIKFVIATEVGIKTPNSTKRNCWTLLSNLFIA